MVQFAQNGQGFWDFDHAALEELTNKWFVEDVKYAFKFENVKDVVFKDFDTITIIEFYYTDSMRVLIYDKGNCNILNNFTLYSEMKKHLEHAIKVGAYVD